jgi:hypothetical protein
VLVDAEGQRIYGPLAGDRKNLTNCRMSLVPGPVKEVRIVREIFRRYLELNETTGDIAEFLNDSGARTGKGNPWHAWYVSRVLENEKYIGTQVYNRHSSKLGLVRRLNLRSEWIRKPIADPNVCMLGNSVVPDQMVMSDLHLSSALASDTDTLRRREIDQQGVPAVAHLVTPPAWNGAD